MQPLVFDSWAVLAFFEDEPAAAQIEAAVLTAHQNGRPLWLSAINAGEVWCVIARTYDKPTADRVINQVLGLGVEIKPIDWPLSRRAAALKLLGKVAYADCFAAALAAEHAGEVLTGAPEFAAFEKVVKIAWLR